MTTAAEIRRRKAPYRPKHFCPADVAQLQTACGARAYAYCIRSDVSEVTCGRCQRTDAYKRAVEAARARAS